VSAPPGLTEAELRRLLDEARAVHDAVGSLEAAAGDDGEAAAWARRLASGADVHWSQLQVGVTGGRADWVNRELRALAGLGPAMAGAPAPLSPAAARARECAERLAADVGRCFDPYLTADGLAPEAAEALTRTVRRIAPPVGPGPADLRQLLAGARAVRDAVMALARHAVEPGDVEWAGQRVAAVQRDLDRLGAAARAGDAVAFAIGLHVVIMTFRPVEDAPPALQPFTAEVLARTDSLARDRQRLIEPYSDGERYFPPDMQARIGADLRRVAAE
jgi:hypothetical protein